MQEERTWPAVADHMGNIILVETKVFALKTRSLVGPFLFKVYQNKKKEKKRSKKKPQRRTECSRADSKKRWRISTSEAIGVKRNLSSV